MKSLYDRLSDGEVMEVFESHRIEVYLHGEPQIPLGRFDLSYDTSQSVLDIYRCKRNDRVVEGVRIISAAPDMAQALDEAKDAIEEMLFDYKGSDGTKGRARRALGRIAEVERLVNTGSKFEKEDGDAG